jgi:hypothetical protein
VAELFSISIVFAVSRKSLWESGFGAVFLAIWSYPYRCEARDEYSSGFRGDCSSAHRRI